MKTARDIMTPSVLTVSPDTTVDTAIRVLIDSGVTGLPVVDETGRLLGIFTEADRLAMLARNQPTTAAQVKDAMSRGVITVEEDTTVEQINDLLLRASIRRVPVMKNGKVVGVVSRRDVVREIREVTASQSDS